IHKRHELVRKAGHCASDTDATYIWAAADSRHPSALSYIALHHRPPTSKLHNAQRRSVLFGKLRLLIVATAITAFMHRVAEEPCRAQRLIEWDHRCSAGCHIKEIQQCLHKVVWLYRASGNADERDLRL